MRRAVSGLGKNVVTDATMSHEKLLSVLIPLYVVVVLALVIKNVMPVAMEDKVPVANEDKMPVAKEDRTDHAGPQADEPGGKRGLTPDCEKELRRTADLLRFFANRIQLGEEVRLVIADMRQQEKKISAACE